MIRFGLIGYPLSHSFSQRYFTEKFEREGLTDYRYDLFAMKDLRELPALLARFPELRGLNVTIPHKQSVIPYLDDCDPLAVRVGAVNTIQRETNGRIAGYNTDVIGFRDSLRGWLPDDYTGQALILGTGGAARAVRVVLEDKSIPFRSVSRTPEDDQIGYSAVDANLLADYHLIINTTPLGMNPKTETKPDIAYHGMGADHYLYDLVYNPEVTAFLREGNRRGARTRNGLDMLYGQAEAAWEIWTESSGYLLN